MKQLELKIDEPGTWRLNAAHFSRPLSKYYGPLFVDGYNRGYNDGLKRYGVLASMHMTTVDGVPYRSIRYLCRPSNDEKELPEALFRTFCLIHPQIVWRSVIGRMSHATSLWRRDHSHWNEVVKPAAIMTNRGLQKIDSSALSVEHALKHFLASHQNLQEMTYKKFLFTAPTFMAVGNFIAEVQQWTGLSGDKFIAVLKGAHGSADDAGQREISSACSAIKQNDEALKILHSSRDPEEILSELMNSPNHEIQNSMRSYVDSVGIRILSGQDVADACASETPSVLVELLKSTLNKEGERVSGHTTESGIGALRDRVHPKYQVRFDELLEDARQLYSLRDERAIYCDQWANGIARRAIIGLGKTLVRKGTLKDPVSLVHASHDEILSLSIGKSGPNEEELIARAQKRMATGFEGIPEVLGASPIPEPPIEWLPNWCRQPARAFSAYLKLASAESNAVSDQKTIRGVPASGGVYEGIARVIKGPEEFSRINSGDVLVTSQTNSNFNIILGVLGGLVTDRGGALSHAAIVAREFNIPSVVGTRSATKSISDGARIRVDGTNGVITILE